MLMKIVANIIGILSIPVYWYVLAVLFSGLFLAIARLEEFFGVGLWVLSPMGWFFVHPRLGHAEHLVWPPDHSVSPPQVVSYSKRLG